MVPAAKPEGRPVFCLRARRSFACRAASSAICALTQPNAFVFWPGINLQPALTERVKVLEHKADALAVDLQEFRRECNKSRQEVQEEFKALRNDLRKHVSRMTSAMEVTAQEIHKRLDAIEDATAHDRARIIEALRNWAISPQTWRDVIPPAWTDAWITTEDLWMDRAQPRYWPALCQDIGLPETSAVRTCAMLALVDIQDSRAPAPFLFVGEASVTMDSGRLHKVIRHAREIATHTAYQAVPCVCADTYAQSMLDMAEIMGAMALQRQRGDAAKVVALPDEIRTFLGWTKRQEGSSGNDLSRL